MSPIEKLKNVIETIYSNDETFGDLSDVEPNTLIQIAGTADIELIVTEQNVPCKNLAPYHDHYTKNIFGRRGLLCAIRSGIGEVLRPGHSGTITIL